MHAATYMLLTCTLHCKGQYWYPTQHISHLGKKRYTYFQDAFLDFYQYSLEIIILMHQLSPPAIGVLDLSVGVRWPGLKRIFLILSDTLPCEDEFTYINRSVLGLKPTPHELPSLLHCCKVTRYTMISLKLSGTLEKCKVIA